MINSFRTIAAIMDPVRPPTGIKELAKRHRWIDQASPDNLPQPLSFRSIAFRHSEPENAARFLSYNTMLPVVFDLPYNSKTLMILLDKLKWDMPKLVEKLGIDFQKFYQRGLFELGKKFLSEECDMDWLAEVLGVWQKIQGFIDDCLNFSTGGIWEEITDWAEVTIDMVLDEAGIENPFEVIEEHFLDVTQFILDYLGWDPWTLTVNLGIGIAEIISSWAGEEIKDPFHIPGEDELPERASEIGEALKEPLNITGKYAYGIKPLSYSIMALCEVFSPDSQARLMTGQTDITPCLGPGIGKETLQGSGLFQMVNGYQVSEQKMMSFKKRCGDQFDIECWANKGVLLTRIDVGCGVIDLFSTHLYWGNNIFTMLCEALKISEEEQLTPAEKAAVRKSQLEELKEFFNKNHPKNSPNVAILTGDFNINGSKPEGMAEYNTLKTTIEALGLRDEWSYQRQFFPKDDPNKADPGYTDGPDKEASNIRNDDLFFQDPAPEKEKEYRFDYIFLEKPRHEHAFNVDISRIRRRHFMRPKQKGKFMSDHMGLDATLIFSAR
ncbi:hypothetical protein JXJ21_15740 [candidate division KSB1 bacterium]|nr:hypothetical protein [candidate division KSB1 bacterium]